MCSSGKCWPSHRRTQKGHRAADGTVALADVFGPARCGGRDAADGGRRLGIGIHIGRRGSALKAAEQKIEQPSGARRARHRNEHRREQRGQCGNVPIQRLDVTRRHHGMSSQRRDNRAAGSIVLSSLGRKHGRKNSTSDDEILHAAAKRRNPKHG